MAVIIVIAQQDSLAYFKNINLLQQGLRNNQIDLNGQVETYDPGPQSFLHRSVYDFSRTAKEKLTQLLVNCVDSFLSGLNRQQVTGAFDTFFHYDYFTDYLDNCGQKRYETMNMLVFNPTMLGYMAQIDFKTMAVRGPARGNGYNDFTVHIAVTCQRYTYFPYWTPNTPFGRLSLEQSFNNLSVNGGM